MKLNRKGFAITGILYTILILFLLLLSSLLAILSARINRLSNINIAISGEIEYQNIIDIGIIYEGAIDNDRNVSNPIYDDKYYITNYRGKYKFTITYNDDSSNVCYSYLPRNVAIIINNDSINYVEPSIDDDGNFFWEVNNLDKFEIIDIFGSGGEVCANDVIKQVNFESVSTSQIQNTIESFTEFPKDPYIDPSGANPPELMNILVPVEYLTTVSGEVDVDGWYVADETTDWYSYNDKRWANAVLVTEESGTRTASAGTLVEEEDVLAYYVWIPRYKYELFNANKEERHDSYDAENTGVHVEFESGTETTGIVSCKVSFEPGDAGVEKCTYANDGNYYTHSAFWWDIDDDGKREPSEELTGIWVGKFELSSNDLDAGDGGGNTAELNVRIKPNMFAWKNNSVSNFFKVIQNMAATENEYGIIDTKTDSHMIKNIEWGAIIYFTHSKYGKCYNGIDSLCNSIVSNTSNYITGGGNYLNNYNQSSTGNVTGIYDLSGGASEYVMGNMIYSDGDKMMSGLNPIRNSGFNGIVVADNYSNVVYEYYSSGIEYPSKYYFDIYAFNKTGNSKYISEKMAHLGDATGEIVVNNVDATYGSGGKTWHNAPCYGFTSTASWFIRGNTRSYDDDFSYFQYTSGIGNRSSSVSTRAILIKK